MTKNVEKLIELEKELAESKRLAMKRHAEALKKWEEERERKRSEEIKKLVEEAERIREHSCLKAREAVEKVKKDSDKIYRVTLSCGIYREKDAVEKIKEIIIK